MVMLMDKCIIKHIEYSESIKEIELSIQYNYIFIKLKIIKKTLCDTFL